MTRQAFGTTVLSLAAAILAAGCSRPPDQGPGDSPSGGNPTDVLAALVDRDRAFDAAAAAGVDQAFRSFVAEDGLLFQPGPVAAGAWLAENSLQLASLRWVPTGAALASSSDLGYTTGPFLATDGSGREARGHYLTIWERSSDGPFTVALDIGTTSSGDGPLPDAPPVTELFEDASLPITDQGTEPAEEALQALMTVDRAYAVGQAVDGTHQVLVTYGAPAVQIHRPGHPPVTGLAEYEERNELAGERPSTSPMSGRVSRSGTLGYIYGSVAVGGQADGGNYVRIWRRDPDGPWMLALELIDVLPE